jgi:hypothetical protein
MPKKKKQSELLRRVGLILKFSRQRSLKDVLERIRPVIVGWVNYFRVGNSRRAFGWIRFEMIRTIRRFVMKQKGRPGCGWKRWSNETIYKEWGLVDNYRVHYFYRSAAKVLPAHQADSVLRRTDSGKPDDRKGHVRFDAAGAGNGFTVRLVRHRQTKETVNR